MTEILETALYADDLAAARRFYGTVVGLVEVTEEPGRHVFFRAGGAMLLIFRPAASAVPAAPGRIAVPTHGARGEGHVCFVAEPLGIAGWVERLGTHGVAVETEVRWPHGPRSLYCRDPAGNSVEFAERALWPIDR
ncbi:MAG: VOC family protein [Pseudomonadota bacterium]